MGGAAAWWVGCGRSWLVGIVRELAGSDGEELLEVQGEDAGDAVIRLRDEILSDSTHLLVRPA